MGPDMPGHVHNCTAPSKMLQSVNDPIRQVMLCRHFDSVERKTLKSAAYLPSSAAARQRISTRARQRLGETQWLGRRRPGTLCPRPCNATLGGADLESQRTIG
jgi:hypothetical protein